LATVGLGLLDSSVPLMEKRGLSRPGVAGDGTGAGDWWPPGWEVAGAGGLPAAGAGGAWGSRAGGGGVLGSLVSSWLSEDEEELRAEWMRPLPPADGGTPAMYTQ
jgi:hypothetical protein